MAAPWAISTLASALLLGLAIGVTFGAVARWSGFCVRGALPLGGAVLGGLMFGMGMVLAGGCGALLPVLAAGGNLRALVTPQVMWLVSCATLRGFLAPPRQSFSATTGLALGLADQSLTTILTRLTGASANVARCLIVAVMGSRRCTSSRADAWRRSISPALRR